MSFGQVDLGRGYSMGSFRSILQAQLLAVWRRRWICIAVAWLVCVAGWIFVAMIPNSYQARTRIYVDTETMLAPLLKGMAIEVNLSRQVEVMQRTLLSRPNIEKVLRSTDQDIRADTPEKREALIDAVEKKTSIRPESARNLFTI